MTPQSRLARVSGCILAAGRSQRFGGEIPKQLVPFEGRPLVRRAAQTALVADLAEVLVVVGYRAEAVVRVISDLPVQVVENPDWAEGQSSSVTSAVGAVAEESDAALFIPCDQPLLTAGVLDALIGAHRRSGRGVVVPTFQGRRGSPALFSRNYYGELAALSGDAGGRQILKRYADDTLFLPLPSQGPLLDVDTREDLEALAETLPDQDPGALPGGLAFEDDGAP